MPNKSPGRVANIAGARVKMSAKAPNFRPAYGNVIPGTKVKIGINPVSSHLRKVTGQHG